MKDELHCIMEEYRMLTLVNQVFVHLCHTFGIDSVDRLLANTMNTLQVDHYYFESVNLVTIETLIQTFHDWAHV